MSTPTDAPSSSDPSPNASEDRSPEEVARALHDARFAEQERRLKEDARRIRETERRETERRTSTDANSTDASDSNSKGMTFEEWNRACTEANSLDKWAKEEAERKQRMPWAYSEKNPNATDPSDDAAGELDDAAER